MSFHKESKKKKSRVYPRALRRCSPPEADVGDKP